MEAVSVYIHIPFCVHRCNYCDFNTYAGLNSLIPLYTQSICREIEILASTQTDDFSISTIYFGGGTPSLLSIGEITKIINSLKHNFLMTPSMEISLEANPGTVSKKFLSELRLTGINRLSLGMQSSCYAELQLLGRQHSYQDVINTVQWSRAAGFENLNLDLIFGIPNQQICTWMENVEAALSLNPEHLSIYALTIEEGTPLELEIHQGLLPEPDQDIAADMYETASDIMAKNGYKHYEISNWARHEQGKDSYECQHNLQYWRTLPYLGIGAGAHGFIEHKRTVNVLKPGEYIERLKPGNNNPGLNFPETPATQYITPISVDTEIGEAMMMGLRLIEEGVSNIEFTRRYGIRLQERFSAQIERLVSLDLLEWAGEEVELLRLTKKGRLLGNQVFVEFI